ncbi:MAG: glycosyltransferase family 4 protein [Verrucomicrobia bacterium]|nr:glycosyltransferase family 4 protein [Verrucomicrobiota bacterium]
MHNSQLEPSRALRILTLCYEWPPVGGGGGRAAKDVAEALVARGHEVIVQTIRLKHLPDRELVNGVKTFRTLGFRRRLDRCSPAEMAGYIVSSAFPAWHHVRSLRPDLIHAHFAVPTGALALSICKATGTPYIVTAHLGDVPGTIPDQTANLFRWLNPFIKPIWNNAAGIVAVSRFVAEMAEKAYRRTSTIIHNGIQIADRPAIPAQSNPKPRMIFVGRLNPQKNLNHLVQVLAHLKDLQWDLDVIGDGEERSGLTLQFEAADLSSRVRFKGWLDRDLVNQHLASADIFLMPSRVEGLSVAVLEALKYGLAIVCSDIPALRECVTNGVNGFLVPVSDTAAWTQDLRKLLTDPVLLLQFRQASWRTAEQFDLARIAAEYELFYHQALAKVKRARARGF